MDKQNEQILNVIDETDIVKIGKDPTMVGSNILCLKTGQCTKKIGCCGGNNPRNAVRIRPRMAVFVGLVLSFWVIWNKYYRKP